VSAKAGLEEKSWRLHDLRRTAAAGMQRLGVRVEVIERALNHRSGSFAGIVGTYQVDPLESEVRAALQAWGDYVEGLLLPKAIGKRRARRA
jgi:integrase